MKNTKSFFIIFSAGIIFFIFFFIQYLKPPKELRILKTSEQTQQEGLKIFNSDPARGPQNAKVTIVEFADFGCEHCKQSAAVLKQISQLYPKDVRIIWKDLPITNRPATARASHVAAQCANRQGRFWEYHDILFANQSILMTKETLSQFAAQLKLDTTAFEKCIQAKEPIELTIDRNIQMAVDLEVDGVPYFIINNKRHLSGNQTLDEWKKNINEELAVNN